MADFQRDTSVPVPLFSGNVMPADVLDALNNLVITVNTAAGGGKLGAYVPVYLVATLPASGNVIGTRAFVSNGTVATGFGVAPTGSGAVLLPVYADTATTWKYG